MYTIKIIREDSKYNKYIKWLAYGEAENGAKFIQGFKTLKEARKKYEDGNYAGGCKIIEINTGRAIYKNIAYK